MRNLLALALATLSVASQAIVVPTGFFPTAPALRSNFDSMAAGPYTSFPVFSGNGIAATFGGGGSLNVGPPAAFLSPPNAMFGAGTDVQIRMNIPMRRFGGYFHDIVLSSGVSATSATFKFYDVSNTLIGSATAPITPTWTWIGYKTAPKWVRVEITGNVGGTLGGVVMDNLRVRPN